MASRTVICVKTVCLATNVGAPKWFWSTVTYFYIMYLLAVSPPPLETRGGYLDSSDQWSGLVGMRQSRHKCWSEVGHS